MKFIKSLFIVFLVYLVWVEERGDSLNAPATMHLTLTLCSFISSCNVTPSAPIVTEFRPQLTPYRFYSPAVESSPKEVAPEDIKPDLFSASQQTPS